MKYFWAGVCYRDVSGSGALGIASNELLSWLNMLGVGDVVGVLQTAAVIGTAAILNLKKVLNRKTAGIGWRGYFWMELGQRLLFRKYVLDAVV